MTCRLCQGEGYFPVDDRFSYDWQETYLKHHSMFGRARRVANVLRGFGLRGLVTHRHMLLSRMPEIVYAACDHNLGYWRERR